MKITKRQLINSACDLFGYSADDFDNMDYQEIWKYLDNKQQDEILKFNNSCYF